MAKPDLIELSTDWDNALLVADRYSGPGGGSGSEPYFVEQGKRLLAAALMIANKQERDYAWIDWLLGERDYPTVLEILRQVINDGVPPQTARHITTSLYASDRERSAIFGTAYLMFSKALQPHSALDPDLLDPSPPLPSPLPTGTPSDPYGDVPGNSPNPFTREG